MDSGIHKTALIEEGAVIGANVEIGAFCVIGKNVKIGDGCVLKPHVVVEGWTTIGKNNKIYSFATIGQQPQDLKFEGEKSEVVIGDNNSIREHCTIHPGTKGDNLITKIGSNNLLMVNTHVAHDCMIGDNCVFANNATLGGHVHVGNNVVLGGLCAIHQKVRIGNGAMLGGLSGLGEDLIPYGIAYAKGGRSGTLQGINLVGLKRANIDKKKILELSHFYKEVFEGNELGSILERANESEKKYKDNFLVKEVVEFMNSDTSRRFCSCCIDE
ncbi:MAG TPA: acyl-ACP--UDP-N-acetylglucosamine O-acyltransferase [Rickettsiales bacterium]|nr:acyl-ACP--UDP-N-acetylglucosamine O-acyltransferase [Rickettsiales bacterium]